MQKQTISIIFLATLFHSIQIHCMRQNKTENLKIEKNETTKLKTISPQPANLSLHSSSTPKKRRKQNPRPKQTTTQDQNHLETEEISCYNNMLSFCKPILNCLKDNFRCQQGLKKCDEGFGEAFKGYTQCGNHCFDGCSQCIKGNNKAMKKCLEGNYNCCYGPTTCAIIFCKGFKDTHQAMSQSGRRREIR